MKIEGSGDDKWQPEVVQLLQKAMEERGWEDGKYLIDGFPRTVARASFPFFEGFAGKTLAEFCRSFDNLQGWNDIVGQKANAVVLFSIPLPACLICCILYCVLGLVLLFLA